MVLLNALFFQSDATDEIPCVPAAARRWNVEFVTPVVHELLGTWVMRGSRIAERITGSLAATGHYMAEAVSGYAVVKEDRDGAYIVKQTKQPEASSPAR